VDLKQLLNQFLNFVNKLSVRQKMLIGGIIVGAIIIIGFSMMMMSEPKISVLYNNLEPEDASQIIEQLKSQKIPYQIDDGGKTIKVPSEKVYELRLQMAAKGLPSSGVVGYELLDKSSLGMSEFQQKLNYKRALEGELARTIMQTEGVEHARVQIVIPEKTIFKSEQKEPTASVVLKLKKNYDLNANSVMAITKLVASSVEGLKPSNVTIIDTKGRLLSKEIDEDPLAISSGKQYELKQKIENYLIGKAQGLLDNVLGYGNSAIQITADIDFSKVEKTLETYDPENQVPVSEQTIRSSITKTDAGDTEERVDENTVINYENSKVIQRILESSGNIKRLSIAGVINGSYKEIKKQDGETEIVFEPRSEEQLKKLEDIVKKAVGFDENRNDQISLITVQFEPLAPELPTKKSFDIKDIDKIAKYILIFLAIGLAMFIIKNILKKLREEPTLTGKVELKKIGAEQAGTIAGELEVKKEELLQSPKKKRQLPQIEDIEEEIPDEVLLRQQQLEKISNYVAKNPADAAKLITAWLREDEY